MAEPMKTVWFCTAAKRILPDWAPEQACDQPRCAEHRTSDCSPLLNGCSWRPPARDSSEPCWSCGGSLAVPAPRCANSAHPAPASGPAQAVSPQVTTAMVEAAIAAWNVAEPEFQITGISYHRTFAEVITAALAEGAS